MSKEIYYSLALLTVAEGAMILIIDLKAVAYHILILYNWLIWRILKLAFFFQKSIFLVFILASGAVRTTLSLCKHIFK